MVVNFERERFKRDIRAIVNDGCFCELYASLAFLLDVMDRNDR